MAPLVVLAVVEIAILDRETDAAGDLAVRTYGHLISVALGLEDEPWEAIALWQAAAPDHLARFAQRWADHLVRAERHSESRYHHDRLVDLDRLGIALDLSRKRIRDVFGEDGCSLSPIKTRQGRFTLEEAAEIRALARRTGYTAEHIGDLAMAVDPEAFSLLMFAREPMMDGAEIDKHRLRNFSDLQIENAHKTHGKKRGRPRKPANLDRQIRAVAKLHGTTPHQVKAWIHHLKLNVTNRKNSGMPGAPVTFRSEILSRSDENTRSVIPEFSPSLSPESGVVRYSLDGVEITDPYLIEVALLDSYLLPGRFRAKDRAERDLIIAYWEDTRGETPKNERMRQWRHRGLWAGYLESARLWNGERRIQARAAAEAADTLMTINAGDDTHATRPVRHPDHAAEAADPAPHLEAEDGPDARPRT